MIVLQVYDIAFSRAGGGRDMFASVGADGSVRMFDLRHLEHSTIIYEVACVHLSTIHPNISQFICSTSQLAITYHRLPLTLIVIVQIAKLQSLIPFPGRTLGTSHCCDCVGTNRTPTTWPPWLSMGWRLVVLCDFFVSICSAKPILKLCDFNAPLH